MTKGMSPSTEYGPFLITTIRLPLTLLLASSVATLSSPYCLLFFRHHKNATLRLPKNHSGLAILYFCHTVAEAHGDCGVVG
jgi:hypothetical protein